MDPGVYVNSVPTLTPMINGATDRKVALPIGAITNWNTPPVGAVEVYATTPAGAASRMATWGVAEVACQAPAGAPTIVPVLITGETITKVDAPAGTVTDSPMPGDGIGADIVSNAGGTVTPPGITTIGAAAA
jgi:hypothetical protein